MKIKNRFTGKIIVEREAESIKELVEYCVKNKISLFQADLSRSNLSYSDLRGSNLRGSNLSYSDLRGSDLSGSDLDFSCLPLWCGSLSANFDDKQLIQIAYHLVKAGLSSKNASDETKGELKKIIDFANKFHRIDECGKIERE